MKKRLMLSCVLALMTSVVFSQRLIDEDFEGLPLLSIPQGWDRSESSVDSAVQYNYNWSRTNQGLGHESDYALTFNSTFSQADSIAVLKTPIFSLGAAERTLSFYYKNEVPGNLSIYVSTDGGATYLQNPLLEDLMPHNDWTRIELNLTNYKNQKNVRIVFKAISTGGFDELDSPYRTTLPPRQKCGAHGVGEVHDYNIYIDDVVIDYTPTCAMPMALLAENITMTSASLSWDMSSSGDMSSYYRMQMRDSHGNLIIDNPSLYAPYFTTQLTGLTPGKQYSVTLQGDCSSDSKGYSTWSDIYIFSTLCDSVDLPIYEDGTYVHLGHLPDCWLSEGNASTCIDHVMGGEGDKSLRIESTESYDASLSTPVINHEANDLEIAFSIIGPIGTKYRIALTSLTSGDFALYDGIIDKDYVWQEVLVNTSSTPLGTEKGVSVKFYMSKTDKAAIWIDNVSVYEKPSCVAPTNLRVQDVLDNSAKVDWTDEFYGSGTYQVQLQTEGLLCSDTIVLDSSCEFVNLDSDTEYSVRVRKICSVGDTSLWLDYVEFMTVCEPTVDFPIEEGFEGNVFPPSCWKIKQNKWGTGDGEDYGDAAWYGSRLFPQSGERTAEHYYNNKNGTSTFLAMPYMTIPSANTHEITFSVYRKPSAFSLEGVKVWVNSTLSKDGAIELAYQRVNKDMFPIEPTTGWYTYSYLIPMSGDVYVFFEAISEHAFAVSIDDVILRERPNCTAINRVEQDTILDTSCIFTWDVAIEENPRWIVSYSLNEGDEFIYDTVSTNSYTISGLDMNTYYTTTFRVQKMCPGGELSDVRELKISYKTLCSKQNLPFVENFEVNKNTESMCWSFPHTSTYHDLTFGRMNYPMIGDAMGSEMITYMDNIFVTPELDVDDWGGKEISFDAYSESQGCFVVIGLVADVDEADSIPMILDTIYLNENKQRYTINTTSSNVGRYVMFATSSTPYHNYYDNIKVRTIPACSDVVSARVDSINTLEALLWINDEVNTEWEVQYSEAPFDESVAIGLRVTDKKVRLVGLTERTTYAYRVRSVCGLNANKGEWTDVQEFRTLCNSFVVSETTPFIDGFEEGYVDNMSIRGCWTQEIKEGEQEWMLSREDGDMTLNPYRGVYSAKLSSENLSYGGTETYMRQRLELKANTAYYFQCYARQRISTDVELNIGIHNERGEEISLIDLEKVVNGDYQLFDSYFMVAQTGDYYLQIGAKMNYAYPVNYVSIDEVEVREVECAPPFGIEVRSLQHDSVVLGWDSASTQYLMKVSSVAIDPAITDGDMFNDTINADEITLRNLDGNSTYYYYIKSLCGGDMVSGWTTEGEFTTNCELKTLPYFEGFESEEGFSCWDYHSEYPPQLIQYEAYSGESSLRVSDMMLVGPTLNVVNLEEYQLEMMVYAEQDSLLFSIGVLADINDITTFEPLADVVVPHRAEWTEVGVDFSVLSDPMYAPSRNIAIFVQRQNSLLLDDIRVEKIPTCPKIRQAEIDQVESNSARISWISNAIKTQVVVAAIGIDTIVTGQECMLLGLLPNMDYEVKLRSICSDGDSSMWIMREFTTMCRSLYELPFTEDFEQVAHGDVVSCWDNSEYWDGEFSYGYYNRWTAYEGQESRTTSYEFNSQSNSNGNWSILCTPRINLTSVSQAMLEFELKNQQGVAFEVRVSTDGGENYSENLVANHESVVSEFTSQEVDLSAYCGNEVIVAFKGTSNGSNSYKSYIRIDNIEIYEPSPCQKPEGIIVSKVDIDTIEIIVDRGDVSATTYDVALVQSGMEIVEDDILQFMGDTIQLSGVQPSTKYEIYLRRACDDGSVSRWVKSDVITTPCAAQSLPYIESFDGLNAVEDILCVDIFGHKSETNYYPIVELNRYDSYQGDGALYLTSGETESIYYVLPEFEASIDTLTMKFHYKNGGLTIDDSELEVGLIPNSLEKKDFVLVASLPKVTTYENVQIDFVHIAAIDSLFKYDLRDYRIALRYKSLSLYKYMTIDEMRVEYREECVRPMQVIVDEISSSSARIKIDDVVNEQWEIKYGSINDSFDNLQVVENVLTDTLTIGGLDHSQGYQVYARAFCGGEFTDWTAQTRFSTQCQEVELEEGNIFVENFEQVGDNEIPVCWNVIEEYVGYDKIYPSVDVNAGFHTIELNEGASAIALPEFSAPLNRLFMEFDAQSIAYGGSAKLYLATSNCLVHIEHMENIYEFEVSNQEEHISIDLGAFPSDTRFLILRTMDSRGVRVDNIEVTLAPKCHEPKGLMVSDIRHNGVDFEFRVSQNSVQSEYILSAVDSNEVISRSWITETSYGIDNLAPGTEYALTVRSKCVDTLNNLIDTTQWCDTVFFRTFEEPAVLPYNEDFECDGCNSHWQFYESGPNEWIISLRDASAIFSGEKSLYVTNDGATNQYDGNTASTSWAYRTLYLEKGMYSFDFTYKIGGDYSDNLRVFLVPASQDFGKLSIYDQDNGLISLDGGASIFGARDWTTMSNDINVPEAGYYQLSFMWQNDFNITTNPAASIDEISLVPFACSAPVNSHMGDIYANSATIKIHSYHGNIVCHQLILKDNEASIEASDLQTIVSTHHEEYKFEGLLPQTQYQVYLRTICAEGDTSQWTQAIGFITTCQPDTMEVDRHYFESFENYSYEVEVGDCWSQHAHDSENKWLINSNVENLLIESYEGDKYAYLSYGSESTLKREFYLYGGLEYSFEMMVQQSTDQLENANIKVELSKRENHVCDHGDHVHEHEGVVYNLLDEKVGGDGYERLRASVTPAESGLYSLNIIGETSDITQYLVIDNVRFGAYSCDMPREVVVDDITRSSVTMSWLAMSDTCLVKLLDHGLVVCDSLVIGSLENKAVTISGLDMATKYEVHLVSICQGEESMLYTTNIVTECGEVLPPYAEYFDEYAETELPLCWSNAEGTSSEVYRWQVGTESAVKDNKVMKFNSFANEAGRTSLLRSIPFVVEEMNKMISIDYKNPAGGDMSIFVSSDNGDTYCDTLLFEEQDIEEWQTAAIRLDKFLGDTLVLIVSSESNNEIGDAYHYLDNFIYDCAPGVKEYYDTVCEFTPYVAHGFVIMSDEVIAGERYFEFVKQPLHSDACDTIMKLYLLVNKSYVINIDTTVCANSTLIYPPFDPITQAGTYVYNFVTQSGCDSTVRLHVANYPSVVYLDSVICEGDSVWFDGRNIGKSGMYQKMSVSSYGCDSITILILKVLDIEYDFKATICKGEVYWFVGSELTESGFYSDTLVNSVGCDSILNLDLTVRETHFTLDSVICRGKSVYFGGSERNETGQYEYIYTSSLGCDSVVILNLVVDQADTIHVEDVLCEGYLYTNYGLEDVHVYSDTMLYSTKVDPEGCLQDLAIDIQYVKTIERYDTVRIYEGEQYAFCGNDLTTSGDYECLEASSLGCDSIVYCHLIVDPKVGVTLTEDLNMRIVPNPVNVGQTFVVELGEPILRLEVYNQRGMVESALDLANESEVSIKAPSTVGVYLIKATTNSGEEYIAKLVVI